MTRSSGPSLGVVSLGVAAAGVGLYLVLRKTAAPAFVAAKAAPAPAPAPIAATPAQASTTRSFAGEPSPGFDQAVVALALEQLQKNAPAVVDALPTPVQDVARSPEAQTAASVAQQFIPSGFPSF